MRIASARSASSGCGCGSAATGSGSGAAATGSGSGSAASGSGSGSGSRRAAPAPAPPPRQARPRATRARAPPRPAPPPRSAPPWPCARTGGRRSPPSVPRPLGLGRSGSGSATPARRRAARPRRRAAPDRVRAAPGPAPPRARGPPARAPARPRRPRTRQVRGDRLDRDRLDILGQLRGERHLRAPARRLQRHRAACAVALPGDGGLGLEAGDADLAELAEMPREMVDVGDLGPQLGWALDQGPLGAWLLHRVAFRHRRAPTLPSRARLRRLQSGARVLPEEDSPSSIGSIDSAV